MTSNLPESHNAAPWTKRCRVLGVAAGIAIGFAIPWALDPRSKAFPPTDYAAPQGALRLAMVVGLVSLVYFAFGLMHLTQMRRAATSAEQSHRPKLRRPVAASARSFLFLQILLVGMLVIFAGEGHWTAATVGLDSKWPALIGMFVGVITYCAFLALMHAALSVAGKLDVVDDGNMRVMAGIWPRLPLQKVAMFIAMCMFNPVTEELMFRGILVHQFSVAIESLTMPVVVGLIANLANHAYQGAWATSFHAVFYFVAVGLLFSPTGLWGAIGFHWAGDFVPVASLNASVQRFRSRHRRAA